MTQALNPALRDFWRTFYASDGSPVRYRVLEGGRSSSKTHDAAGWAVILARSARLRFVCARQFQSKIEESVYAVLKLKIYAFGWEKDFRILDNKIICKSTGSEFVFYGLWRSIDEIKGLEDIDIMWIEEGHNLTKEQFDVLDPTLRKQGSQFWIIFNPNLATDFVWKRFIVNPLPGTLHRQINYIENPYLSETIQRVIEAAKADDPDEYSHIYLGVPRDDDDQVVIKRSWIMAAIDLHKRLGIEPRGRRRIGFDVADGGKDKCATIETIGTLAHKADLWKAREDELLKSATRVWAMADDSQSIIVYDSIGVGAFVGAHINSINSQHPTRRNIYHVGFNAGGEVYNKEEYYRSQKPNGDMFSNIKAQTWWLVADLLRNSYIADREHKEGKLCRFKDDEMIFIDSGMAWLNLLIDELATPLRDFDNAGRVKVESKKDLAKATRHGGPVPSPNLADAFVMNFAPGHMPMMISPDVIRPTLRVA